MNVLGIDPGQQQSAWVLYDPRAGRIVDFKIQPNGGLAWELRYRQIAANYLAIEMVGHYGTGMAVGKSIFDTCLWIGRFIEAFPGPHSLILRKTVCAHLCGSARAGDPNIRQAIIDRFPPIGGGHCPQIGTKKQPGPLYGIKRDLWSALAIAITWAETQAAATSTVCGTSIP